MFVTWRRWGLAVAIFVAWAASPGQAQTVIVLNAPTGATVDVAVNTTTVGSATADALGRWTLALPAATLAGKPAATVRVYVDTCVSSRRVVIVESGSFAIPPGGCARADIAGAYRMSPVTTFLFDLGSSEPSVKLRQGPAPVEWFLSEAERAKIRDPEMTPRSGVYLFAGGGLGAVSVTADRMCGSVAGCKANGIKSSFATGAGVWFGRFVGFEGAYFKPLDVTGKGSDTGYSFDERFSAQILALSMKVAVPIQRVRLYATGGGTYTWSTSQVDETVEDKTVTVEENTVTLPGGSQSMERKTKGWGWTLGAGVEVPFNKTWLMYIESGRIAMKGDDVDGGEVKLRDRLFYAMVGLKVRFGG